MTAVIAMITKDELYLVSKDWIAAMYCTWRVIFIVWFSTPIAVYGALPNQLKNNSRADATAVMQNFEYLDARTVAPSSILNVAKDGAPYSSVSDALRAINDASVDNTYLINVAAGVFTEDSTIYLKSHVYIKGVGPRATVIECACDIAIVAASIESQLSNLSLHARGTGNGPAVALRTTGASQKFNLQNMLLTAEGGTENIGIEVMGGSTVLDTVITHPEFPPNTTGIKASNGARLIVRNADIRGSTRGAIIQGGSR